MFRDFSYAKQVQQYHGAPIEEMRTLGDKLELRYQTNLDTQDKLEQYIDSLDVRDLNRPHVMKAYENAKNRLAKIREGGNWEDAEHDVRLATKEFSSDKNVRGALKDKAAYDAWGKELEEQYKAGKVDPETYKLTKQYSMELNSKALEYDPKTGEYKNIFNGYTPQNFQDIQKAVMEMGKEWKASSEPVPLQYKDAKGNIVTKQVKYDNLQGYFVVPDTHERITEEELQAGLSLAVMANPMYKGFLQEQLMFDKYKKFGAGTERAVPITFDNVINADASSGALLNISEDEARKYLTEAGYDYDKIKNDPTMAEALYDQIRTMKMVDGYIKPAAMAYSYDKIDQKFLTDNVLMESIKHANDLDKQKRQHQHERDMESFKLSLQEKPLHVANPAALIPGNAEFDMDKLETNLSQYKGELKNLEKQLEAHKDGKGKGDYAVIKAQYDQVKARIASTEGVKAKATHNFLNTPEGQSYLDKVWNDPDVKIYYRSREEVEAAMRNGSVLKTGLEGTINDYSKNSIFAGLNRMGVTLFGGYKDNETLRQAAQKERINAMIVGKFNNKVNNYTKTNGGSMYGNVMYGSAGSVEEEASKTLTTFVKDHMSNYTVAGGAMLDDTWNALVKKYGKDVIEGFASMSDGEAVNGQFPQYWTVTDKKTGAVIEQIPIFPAGGGSDIRYDVGYKLVFHETKQGDEANIRGWHLMATSRIPQWNTTEMDQRLYAVNDRSPEGTKASSGDFTVQGINGPVVIAIEKERIGVHNAKGEKVGINTGYRVVQKDPVTGKVIGYLPNPARMGTTASPAYQTSFANQDDARVELFKTLNPNLGPTGVVTGYSKSSSKSSSN